MNATVIVGPDGRWLYAPTTRSEVGRARPLGRGRMLYALPLNPGPALLSPPTVFVDPQGAILADPKGNAVGRSGLYVSRFLTATTVEDTRSL